MDKYTSLSKVDQSLVDYKVNKKDKDNKRLSKIL